MDTDNTGVEAIDREFTRRDFLIYQAVMNGADPLHATDLVDSWATNHPEYATDETMTWADWQDRDDAVVASDFQPLIDAVEGDA